MFKTRLISGIILVLITILANCLGGLPLMLLLLVTALIGIYEFYKAMDVCFPVAVAGYIGTIAYFIVGYITADMYYLLPVIVLVMVAMLAIYVFWFPKYVGDEVMRAMFGFIYVPVMIFFIYLTRDLMYGEYLVWLIYISSWGCDTCAYCTGMLIGKRKLAPILSPKKSVEGAVGGVIGAMIISILYAFIFRYSIDIGTHPVFVFAVVTVFGALISQIGDLAASAFKRNKDIKDYGNLIPGHGGILDRFDSVIFTAPIVFFVAELFM